MNLTETFCDPLSNLPASRYKCSNRNLAALLANKWALKAHSIHKVLKGNFWVYVTVS
jgi:hypothetical protein